MGYTIEYGGTHGDDAFVCGDLAAAVNDSEIAWVRLVPRQLGGFHAFGGFSSGEPVEDATLAEVDRAADYWANGRDEDEALRFLHGAALDPREGR